MPTISSTFSSFQFVLLSHLIPSPPHSETSLLDLQTNFSSNFHTALITMFSPVQHFIPGNCLPIVSASYAQPMGYRAPGIFCTIYWTIASGCSRLQSDQLFYCIYCICTSVEIKDVTVESKVHFFLILYSVLDIFRHTFIDKQCLKGKLGIWIPVGLIIFSERCHF